MPLSNRKIISATSDKPSRNRIGGNMPACFAGQTEQLHGLNFYASFQHPHHAELDISIFIPQNYPTLLDGNIYPNCAVKVFVHPHSGESRDSSHRCPDLNKNYFGGYRDDEHEEGIVQIGGSPQLIQDEGYYTAALTQDGYVFFMQIDEAHYPEQLLAGSYPFSYGALYLYCRAGDTKNIIAGFWQYS